jgi:hypothetical protein
VKPPVPTGPLVSLVYRVAPHRRAELLRFLAGAFPAYERHGGTTMALYESADEPGLLFELVAYAGEAEYQADQERMERDPEMRVLLSRWKSLLDGPVEVRRFRPLPVTGSWPSSSCGPGR